MKQFSADKYNVAWYKLAEFVARGEKERALGMYRLLMHSFENEALASQLAGDIFLSFNDIADAVKKYEQAAYLYKKNNQCIEAAAVYEHIISLYPDSEIFLKALFELYMRIDHEKRGFEVLEQLVVIYINKNQLDALASYMQEVEQTIPQYKLFDIYEKIIITSAHTDMILTPFLSEYMQIVMMAFMKKNGDALQLFLEKLKAANKRYYEYSCQLIENDI
ncbi:MAG: hypothetical protein WDZ41_05580 [Candidatus Babeliales bacterium]